MGRSPWRGRPPTRWGRQGRSLVREARDLRALLSESCCPGRIGRSRVRESTRSRGGPWRGRPPTRWGRQGRSLVREARDLRALLRE